MKKPKGPRATPTAPPDVVKIFAVDAALIRSIEQQAVAAKCQIADACEKIRQIEVQRNQLFEQVYQLQASMKTVLDKAALRLGIDVDSTDQHWSFSYQDMTFRRVEFAPPAPPAPKPAE